MGEVSKETNSTDDKDMAFKNMAISKIKELSNENSKLKYMIGRKDASQQRRNVSSSGSPASRIQGLQTLRNTLGTQFMKKKED
jgi:hypothetical protein